MEELHQALRHLKTNKAPDCAGIAAEMLKSGGESLHAALLLLMNSVLQPEAPTPKSWQHTVIKVLHKGGDPRQAQNYRPIATIPMLYKLFSRLLHNRLYPLLDGQQSSDQAGFRHGRGTTDHLFTATILQETADEWRIPLYVAAVDFKEAFDCVTHSSIWESLTEQGTPPAYTQLLSKLYSYQTASVRTDRNSRTFEIRRGTKQGDPL
eukprot:7119675-Pyramimonas_sp.AAC.1